MIYKAIGIMSGSSLDGIDIAFTTITSVGANWEFNIEYAKTYKFSAYWQDKLQTIHNSDINSFLNLHTEFGRYIGNLVNEFIATHNLYHKVHFIASHGHTIYHNPAAKTSFQLGDGASIAATSGLTTISDLRNMDIAFGGQGAPIVPITDMLLFKDYKYCLNIGGIANISIKHEEKIESFDICAANQILNHFAQKVHLDYDENGSIAAQGVCDDSIIATLNEIAYFKQSHPKSLDNNFSKNYIIPSLEHLTIENALNTACEHIATSVYNAIIPFYNIDSTPSKMLVTGGGAYNSYLIQRIQQKLEKLNIEIIVPENYIIEYKEALAMAMSGVLRWREENNVLASVTGATKDSIGGCVWLAQ